jgi:hypothetical protein
VLTVADGFGPVVARTRVSPSPAFTLTPFGPTLTLSPVSAGVLSVSRITVVEDSVTVGAGAGAIAELEPVAAAAEPPAVSAAAVSTLVSLSLQAARPKALQAAARRRTFFI